MRDRERDGRVEGPGVRYEVVVALVVFVSEPWFVRGPMEEECEGAFDCAGWVEFGASMRDMLNGGRYRDGKKGERTHCQYQTPRT